MVARGRNERFNDNTRGGEPTRAQSMVPRGKPIYDKVYVGIVKDNRDVQKMGRLRVFIPEFGGAPTDESRWVTVRYCSPFGGATPPTRNKVDGTQQSESQQSYGMWMVCPDLENEVVVLFINGEPGKGIYIGSLFQQFMNSMVPAIAAGKSHDGGPELDGQPLDPPTTERNKRDTNQTEDTSVRPRHEPSHRGLVCEGLYTDGDRGPSTASSRRESPSQVFGLNSPRGHQIFIDDGEIETEEGTGKAIMNGNEVARKPLANEYIRMRTRSGTQILINDTLGYIYLNSKLGNSWVEISDEGISMYTAKNFNIRAQENMNIRVDGNLNLEVLGITQWVNGGDFKGLFKSDHHTKVDGELRLTAQGNISIGSKGNIVIGADGQIIHTANRIIQSAGRIDQNSFKVAGPDQASDVAYSAQRDRKLASPGYPEDSIGGAGSVLDERGFVTHEPWNYHQRIKTPNNSEDTVGVITADCPPPETNPNTDTVDPVTEEPLPADNPRVDPAVDDSGSSDFEYKPSSELQERADKYEEDVATLNRDLNKNIQDTEQLIADGKSGKIDENSPEYAARLSELTKDTNNIEARGQALAAEKESILREKAREQETQRKAYEQSRAPSAGRVPTTGPTQPTVPATATPPRNVSQEMNEIIARENVAIAAREAEIGRPLTFSEKTAMMTESSRLRDQIVADMEARNSGTARPSSTAPAPSPAASANAASRMAEFQALRAREAGRISAEEARLGRRLTPTEINNLTAASRAALADIEKDREIAARRRANTNPGSRTALPITVGYVQDLVNRTITLPNGAVIRDALRDATDLSVSDEMFAKIRGEYPFRSTVTTVKETGVKIIGHGTQVTDELVSGFQNGVLNIGNTVIEGVQNAIGGVVSSVVGTVQGVVSTVQNTLNMIKIGPELAEQMLRARVGQIEDVLRSSLKVPVTQNQFDAMVSLGEHIGPEELAKSPVVAAINDGDVQGAVDSYNCYTHGGAASRRRRGEAGTMASGGPGDPTANPGDAVKPEPVEGSGKLSHGRPTQEMLDHIDEVSAETGIPREYLLGMVAQESAFNPNAKAGTSSATGLTQFTDSTWKQYVDKYGDQYGLTMDGRTDPRQSIMAGALFARDNKEYLERRIGRTATPTDLYAAHFLGPGGAAKLLSADRNALVVNVASSASVDANKSVFLNRDGSSKTVGELYTWMQGKTEATGITYSQAFPPRSRGA